MEAILWLLLLSWTHSSAVPDSDCAFRSTNSRETPRCKACTSISTNIRRASERLAVHTKQSRAFVRACVHVYDASSSIHALADRDKIESGKVRDIALCTITWNLNVKTTWAGNYYTYTTRSCWVGITAKKVNKHYRSVVTCDCALPCRPHKKNACKLFTVSHWLVHKYQLIDKHTPGKYTRVLIRCIAWTTKKNLPWWIACRCTIFMFCIWAIVHGWWRTPQPMVVALMRAS